MSNMTHKEETPAQKAGIVFGNKYAYKGSTVFPDGTIVILCSDDGSHSPAFEPIDPEIKSIYGNHFGYIDIEDISPFIEPGEVPKW